MRVGRATYGIAAARVDVAQPVDDAVYFVELVAVLGIILVDVEGEQGGIDRSICVQHLHSATVQLERTSVGRSNTPRRLPCSLGGHALAGEEGV